MTRSRLTAALLGSVLILGLAACADDPSPAPTAASSTRPSAPFVVAASAVGDRSRAQVVSLHAAGASTHGAADLPRTQLPAQGAAIRDQLSTQITEATRLPPPRGSAAAQLVSSLRSYRQLAAELARWNPSGAGLPRTWFETLRRADGNWKQSLEELSQLSGRDLLAGLPDLVLPAS